MTSTILCSQTSVVAPLAGSVDRNGPGLCHYKRKEKSLPSRGAWIEIRLLYCLALVTAVAPLAGSVDRNPSWWNNLQTRLRSLPSRGAWIEILLNAVASLTASRRSPRGERG